MQRLIVANWKMQLTVAEAAALARRLRQSRRWLGGKLVLCPSFTALAAVGAALRGSAIALGAQNVAGEDRGAWTGEVSPLDLRSLGCRYVIVGHSDRRRLGESDEAIRQKLRASLRHRLTPILCVGETLAERRGGRSVAVVRQQLTDALRGLTPSQAGRLILAYEPVWAISPGGPARPEQAFAMVESIWRLFRRSRPLLYGGSVTPATLGSFLDGKHFRGALVGQASLKARPLLALVNS